MKKIVSLATLIAIVVLLASCATTGAASGAGSKGSKEPDLFDQLDPVIQTTFDKLTANLSPRLRIAILPPGGSDRSAASYVFDELYVKFVNSSKYQMTDRADIDKAIAEIDFGMTGLVSDDTAAALGKILGAQVIVFGDMPDFGTSRQRLVFRALEVETAKMVGITSERY
jgi:hypothetical protein